MASACRRLRREVDSELLEHAEVLELDPFLGELAGIVVAEDVHQLEADGLSGRMNDADGRVRVQMFEHAGHRAASSEPFTFGDDLLPRKGEPRQGGAKCSSQRFEIFERHVAAWAVEDEAVRKVRVDYPVITALDAVLPDAN